MNEKRLAREIGFIVAGSISFVPLIFLRQVIRSFNTNHFELIFNLSKAILIILGIIFLGTGIYNLILLFFEEEEPTKIIV